MKSTKKHIPSLFFLIMLLLPLGVMAQRPQPPTPEQREAETNKIVQTLGLTDAQTKQFKNIDKTFHQQMKNLHEQQATKEEKREKMMAIRKEKETQLKALLTPKQMEKLKTLRPPKKPHGNAPPK